MKAGFLRYFRGPVRVPRIENRVPRISENYHRVPRIRENRVPTIREIGSLQGHTGHLTFSLKKNWLKRSFLPHRKLMKAKFWFFKWWKVPIYLLLVLNAPMQLLIRNLFPWKTSHDLLSYTLPDKRVSAVDGRQSESSQCLWSIMCKIGLKQIVLP